MYDNPTCFANHMGWWAIDSKFISSAVAAARNGTLVARDPSDMCMAVDFNAVAGEVVNTNAGGRYTRHADGMATVRIDGPMMKGFSKYGGTSTIATRVALRAAVDDPKVKAVMIITDSPGGTVAGTETLADAVQAAASVKPVATFVDDLSASAAVWATAGSTTIYAGPGSRIGSVGVIAMLEDSSEAMEKDGIKVLEFSTGEFKGVGAPGLPVTEEHQDYMQALVDDMGVRFFSTLQAGRNLTDEQMAEITTAKVFSAEQAQAIGLVDEVATFDQAAASLMASVRQRTVGRRGRAASLVAQARLIT